MRRDYLGAQPTASEPSSAESARSARPMDGLHFIEYGNLFSGPYCARYFADSGAEVVKVEPPGGDESRAWGPFPGARRDPEASGLFLFLNANKKGVTLDVRSDKGKRALLHLLSIADVFVANHDLDTLLSSGFDFASLHRHNPRLVVTYITPFGLTGPYSRYKGDEFTLCNASGLSFETPGSPDYVDNLEKEPPLTSRAHLAGVTAGAAAALGTISALMMWNRDGVGRLVEVSEQECMTALLTMTVLNHEYADTIVGRDRFNLAAMPHAYLPCQDGYIVFAAPRDHLWQKMLQAMGNPEWANREEFRTSRTRSIYWDMLFPHLLEWTVDRTGEEITAAAQSVGVPCFPVYTVAQVADSVHARERGAFTSYDPLASNGPQSPRLPHIFSETPWQPVRRAPRLGEHNREVLP